MPVRHTARLPVYTGQAARRAKRVRQTGNLCSADCPTRTILDHIASRWGSLVLVLLLERAHRFSELARRIGGVSEKMLAQTLRHLEADGFVARTVLPTKPPKVEYALTAFGRELASHVKALTNWIESNVLQVIQHRQCNQPERPVSGSL